MQEDEHRTAGSIVERVTRFGEDSLLDQIDVPLYAVNGEGICVRINRAGEQLLGYTRAEVLGKDMHTLTHAWYPDGRVIPRSECRLLQAGAEGRAARGLAEVLWAKDGSAIPLECSASPAVMDDGSLGTVITLRDLRSEVRLKAESQAMEVEQAEVLRQRDAMASIEREVAASEVRRQRAFQLEMERIAAHQLREQQELMGVVAETMPVGIAVLDAQASFRWANESYHRSLDPAFQEIKLQGASLFTVIPENNLAEIQAIVGEVQRTGKTYLAEAYALAGIQRGITYWRWSLSRLENGDLMSTGTDVTDAVRARAEVEAVYANAPIALALVDARTMTYLRCNIKFAELCGVAPDILTGKRAGSFTLDRGADELFKRAAAGETLRNELCELVMRSNPQQRKSLLLNATPNRDGQGDIDVISLAIVDVTTQKRAEDALVRADKLAAVGRLAASISHEINNPLEAVTNLLYLLHSDTNLSTDSQEYLKLAESELARVSQIASQTLRFHRHAVKPVELTPPQVVEPVVALYQGRLKNSRITVKVHHRDREFKTFLHEGDVRQILNNLLGNAIDAMPNGGTVRICTRAARCARTHSRGTRISVLDEGHGMNAETTARIFEPFFTTKGSGGSGLGLWISHTLAKRQNGALQVRSRLRGEGADAKGRTVFSLFIPDQRDVSTVA